MIKPSMGLAGIFASWYFKGLLRPIPMRFGAAPLSDDMGTAPDPYILVSITLRILYIRAEPIRDRYAAKDKYSGV